MPCFLDTLPLAVTAANSRLPLAACLPGDSCYDCLKSSMATTHHAEALRTAVWSPFNPQFIRFVVPDDFSNEPIN